MTAFYQNLDYVVGAIHVANLTFTHDFKASLHIHVDF
jgi:hypothetical protein